MTIFGASREAHTDSSNGEIQTELRTLDNSQNDITIVISSEPQSSTKDHNSLPSLHSSTPSASDSEDKSRDVKKPLLETGNGSKTSPPDMTKIHTETEEDDDGIPYDRGWAWMVVLGQFVNFFLIAGFMKSSGLIFVELLNTFHASATHAATLFALRAAVFSFGGFYVMNVLLGQFGTRKLGLVGAILFSLSAILASLAEELMLLICLHSILLGAGVSMIMSPGEVLTGQYFRKRRSLAIGLAKCGVSLGNVVIPPLLTFLLAEFGLRGTLLLYGGVCLHSLPATMLHRPLSYFSKQRHRRAAAVPRIAVTDCDGDDDAPAAAATNHARCSRKGDTLRDNVLKSEHLQQVLKVVNDNQWKEVTGGGTDPHFMTRSQEIVPVEVTIEECDPASLARSQPEFGLLSTSSLPPPRKRTLSEIPEGVTRRKSSTVHHSRNFLHAVSQSSIVRYMSVASLDGVSAAVLPPPSSHTQSQSTHHNRHNGAGICQRLWRGLLQCPQTFLLKLDFSLFRQPLFVLLIGYASLHPFLNMVQDYLPATMVENGISESRSALLLSVIGGLDFVSRLTSGFVANLTSVRTSTLIAVSFVLLGIVVNFVTFMSTFAHFVVLGVVQGLLGGVGNCLYAVLVIELVGVDNMGKGLGFCVLASGASQALFYPLLGYIRDLTGSYAMTYHVIGIGMLTGALVVGMEGPVRRFHARRRQQQEQQQQ